MLQRVENQSGFITLLAAIITVVVTGGTILAGTAVISNVNEQGCGKSYSAWRSGDIYGDLADADNLEVLEQAEKCQKAIYKSVEVAKPVGALMSAAGNLGGGDDGGLGTIIVDRQMDLLDNLSNPEHENPIRDSLLPPAITAKLDESKKSSEPPVEAPFVLEPLIGGIVTNAETQKPLTSATAKIAKNNGVGVSSVKADSNGDYLLRHIEEGSFVLTISAPEFIEKKYKVVISGKRLKIVSSGGSSIIDQTYEPADSQFVDINTALQPIQLEEEIEPEEEDEEPDEPDAKPQSGGYSATFQTSDTNQGVTATTNGTITVNISGSQSTCNITLQTKATGTMSAGGQSASINTSGSAQTTTCAGSFDSSTGAFRLAGNMRVQFEGQTVDDATKVNGTLKEGVIYGEIIGSAGTKVSFGQEPAETKQPSASGLLNCEIEVRELKEDGSPGGSLFVHECNLPADDSATEDICLRGTGYRANEVWTDMSCTYAQNN